MPGAASLAATHRGKIKNIRLPTLQDASQNIDPRACILDFEKEAVAYDKKQKLTTKSEVYRVIFLLHAQRVMVTIQHIGAGHMEEYALLGHPHVTDYSLSSSFTWVLMMNPLMVELLSEDSLEVDITYKSISGNGVSI